MRRDILYQLQSDGWEQFNYERRNLRVTKERATFQRMGRL